MPPAPIIARISYGPSLSPAERDIFVIKLSLADREEPNFCRISESCNASCPDSSNLRSCAPDRVGTQARYPTRCAARVPYPFRQIAFDRILLPTPGKHASRAASLPIPRRIPRYRTSRNRLLAAETDLRRQVERVARMRRKLPLGGQVAEDYLFDESATTSTPCSSTATCSARR